MSTAPVQPLTEPEIQAEPPAGPKHLLKHLATLAIVMP